MFPDLSFVKYTTQKIIEEIAAGQSRACLPYVSTHTVLSVLERQSIGTGTHSIFNSCKPNKFAQHAFPSLPLLLLALAQFLTKHSGFHSCQRQQVTIKEVSQPEQSRSGLAFRISFWNMGTDIGTNCLGSLQCN